MMSRKQINKTHDDVARIGHCIIILVLDHKIHIVSILNVMKFSNIINRLDYRIICSIVNQSCIDKDRCSAV